MKSYNDVDNELSDMLQIQKGFCMMSVFITNKYEILAHNSNEINKNKYHDVYHSVHWRTPVDVDYLTVKLTSFEKVENVTFLGD